MTARDAVLRTLTTSWVGYKAIRNRVQSDGVTLSEFTIRKALADSGPLR